MVLTDRDTGIEFNIDPAVIVGIYDRKDYTEVRTTTNDGYFAELGKYKVKESVPVIIGLINKEKSNV